MLCRTDHNAAASTCNAQHDAAERDPAVFPGDLEEFVHVIGRQSRPDSARVVDYDIVHSDAGDAEQPCYDYGSKQKGHSPCPEMLERK